MESSAIDRPVERDALVRRYFTSEGEPPLDQIDWQTRTARAGDFVQEDVEAPSFWSDNAVGVVAKLYFATVDGVRETSVRQMIERVARKITIEGVTHRYFGELVSWEITPDGNDLLFHNWPDQANAFYDELCYLLVRQMATFNTPVWLNVGVPGRSQCCSACFLLRVEDTMTGHGKDPHSIIGWWATEAKIFKMGAGSGVNASKLRGSMEPLSTGGEASGPLAYVRASDTNAGTLKSGGAHRRAAKMVILDLDHPDIEDFIDSKPREDRRMRILRDAGEEIDPFTRSGERTIAESTSFQNENQSVSATDEFMKCAIGTFPEDWDLKARTTGKTIETLDAPDLLRKVAEAAWVCGDPGMIFIDAVNRMHTTPSLGPITTCNPCGETWLNDDSSCNLASLNLVRFLDESGKLDIDRYRRAIDVMILAMDITCSFSDLPTPDIERNTRDLRQLGLGYANLGAALMVQGMPYDSDEGRDWAASATALLTGRSYWRSAEIAAAMGPYARFEENRESHLEVIRQHRLKLEPDGAGEIWGAADMDWITAAEQGAVHGYRNSQVTVIPPTGTTRFMMDCDTSGMEPFFALVEHKGLAGGGSMQLVASSVERTLRFLGYGPEVADEIGMGSFSSINQDLRSIFHCANDISPEGHVKMVAAVQPFLSGAPSKTVNLPESATVEDIEALCVLAWRLNCKAISIFRHNSKVTSILSHQEKKVGEPAAREKAASSPPHEGEESAQAHFTIPDARRKMPRTRSSVTHKMTIGDHKAYLTAGMHPDGTLGEIFVASAGKDGSFVQGMWSALAKVTSIALQHGAPLEDIVAQLVGDEFEPRGATGDPDIPVASSMVDYAFRWLAMRFMDPADHEALGILTPEVKASMTERLDNGFHFDVHPATNGRVYERGTRPCHCGGIMHQSGACWTCDRCYTNTGCG